MTDYDIVKLYFARSEKAILETDKKYGAYCYFIADNILENRLDSEECVNDTYLKTWNSVPPQKPNNLRTYLGKITRNLAINRFKHNSAKKRGGTQTQLVLSELENCLPSGNDTEIAFDETLLIKALEKFLKSQSKVNRNIFLRRYWYMSSVKEIAVSFKMSESKVTSVLFRMRQRLKVHLEKEGIFI